MDNRSPDSLATATGDIVHLIKEGFYPLCVSDGKGSVAVFLVEDRPTFAVLTREAQRLVNSDASTTELYERAMVKKHWYLLGNISAAAALVRITEALLERQTA